MVMNAFKITGYPDHVWFVRTHDWNTVLHWLWDNDVEFMQECWTNRGVGFSVTGDKEWLFLLTWA